MFESQVKLMEHSEVKVKLLKTYLDSYFNILSMSNYVDKISYYDLFSSVGIYENGGFGSPIIAIQSAIIAIRFAKQQGYSPNTFSLNFNDIEEGKISELKGNIKSHFRGDEKLCEINYSNENYVDIIQRLPIELKKKLENKERVFTFIDPYGYKDIRIGNIKDVLKNKKSEVLLFLPTHNMFRLNSSGTPECLVEFISEMVPTSDWPKSVTGLEFIDNLKSHMKKFLGSEYFVDNFVITRKKNEFFCLFFFTSHILGFDKMLQAKWKLDEEDGRGYKQGASYDLFSGAELKANTYLLENEIKAFLSSPKTNKEMYEHILRLGFLPTHGTAILKGMDKAGLLEIRSPENNKRNKNCYLSYNNYKTSAKVKVIFTLK